MMTLLLKVTNRKEDSTVNRDDSSKIIDIMRKAGEAFGKGWQSTKHIVAETAKDIQENHEILIRLEEDGNRLEQAKIWEALAVNAFFEMASSAVPITGIRLPRNQTNCYKGIFQIPVSGRNIPFYSFLIPYVHNDVKYFDREGLKATLNAYSPFVYNNQLIAYSCKYMDIPKSVKVYCIWNDILSFYRNKGALK